MLLHNLYKTHFVTVLKFWHKHCKSYYAMPDQWASYDYAIASEVTLKDTG